MQEYLLGTNPTNADTDGDGMSDGLEVYFGMAPAVSNAYSQLPFVENFETNTVVVGDLNGQNGWVALPAGTALVQTQSVHEGAQALALAAGTGAVAMASHLFAPGSYSVVWLDFWTVATPAPAPPEGERSAGAFYFDAACRLQAYDGLLGRWLAVSGAPAQPGAWTRLTVRADFAAGRWDLFRDGLLVAQGLGFQDGLPGFAGFSVSGQMAVVDGISIGPSMPASPDTDGDGIPDLVESSVYGTDPLNPDTDGDGVPDDVEIANGSNPLVADQGSSANGPVVTVLAPEEGGIVLW